MITEKELDAALDRVLRASGSALRNYTMDYTLNQMRAAMREVFADCLKVSVAEPEYLKPCPFCGSNAGVVKGKSKYTNEPWFKVYCVSCQNRTWEHSSKTDAFNAWNRRPDKT